MNQEGTANEVPQAGHAYDVYDLNEIMAFWDKFCK